ncbi:MAG: Rne/Rng family ribonuclease [Desulfobulbaceae bacterium]|nr:Rne/Rng family ribonuclease [Desulfobulbaceae bacterium]
MEEEFSGENKAPEARAPETAKPTKTAQKTRRPGTKKSTVTTPEAAPKKPGRPRRRPAEDSEYLAVNEKETAATPESTAPTEREKPQKKRRAAAPKKEETLLPEIAAPLEQGETAPQQAQAALPEVLAEAFLASQEAAVEATAKKRPSRHRRRAKKSEAEGAAPAVMTDDAVATLAQDAPPPQADTPQPAQAIPPETLASSQETAEETSAKKRPGRRRRRAKRNGTEATAPAVTADGVLTAVAGDAPAERAETPPTETSDGGSWGEGLSEESGDYRDAELLGGLPDDEPEDAPKRQSKLLINAEEPEECRLALLENGRLESIHVSTVNRAQIKSNIYKAKIVAIEANLQAAFVEYGGGKNGFLPFAEIHPEYYKTKLPEKIQKLVNAHQFRKLSIGDVLEKGGELLVQVAKEEIGKKGANMTTYLSIPGRSVVLMPGSDSTGISRKINGETRRSQLREAMLSLNIPEGIGWIVRTAGSDITKAALARDVEYLLRLWEDIRKKGQELEGVGQLYEDHLSVPRFLREHFDPSIEEILVDDQLAYDQVLEFVSLLPEEQQGVKVRLHKGSRPIFNQFSIEDQIESIYQPKVNLPSGGSIVIDATEALVAIDVNSGSTSKGQNFDETIFQANMEAATELARQLRLRDLGGLIVVDFIDMRNRRHIREVEQQVKRAMKRDKARVDISHISKFGLMQISRQKLGAPIESGSYRVCPHCKGRGVVRSVETLALFYLRRIQTGASRKNVLRLECRFPLDVASYLLNAKRRELADIEARHGVRIVVTADPLMKPSDHEISFGKEEKEGNAKKQP